MLIEETRERQGPGWKETGTFLRRWMGASTYGTVQGAVQGEEKVEGVRGTVR